MLVAPFRVFGRVARRGTFPSVGVLSDLAARSEFLTRPGNASLVSRFHHAVGRFPGCVAFPGRAAPASVKQPMRPLFEFRRPPESCPTQPSRPAAASRHLSWASAPYSTRGFGGPLHTGFRLPATFRPQGLVTLTTACSLRAPAGFLSRRRRSWDSPFGASSSRKVSTASPRRKDPRTVSPVGIPAAGAVGRPNGPRFLGFDPSGSPWRRTGFNSSTAGCSLGFRPLRVFRQPP
jgi:hypothetical protein